MPLLNLCQTMTLPLFSLSLTAAWALVGPLVVSERVSHLGQMPGPHRTACRGLDSWELKRPAVTRRHLQPKGNTLPLSQVPTPIYYGPELWRSVRSISGSCTFRFLCALVLFADRSEGKCDRRCLVGFPWLWECVGFSPVVAGVWAGAESDSTERGPVAALHQLPHHGVQQRGGCRGQAEKVGAGSLLCALWSLTPGVVWYGAACCVPCGP